MSMAPEAARPDVPLPERGDRVFLDGLPGGPWATSVAGREGDLLALAPPRTDGRAVELPLGHAFTLAFSAREMPCEADAVLLSAPAAGGVGVYAARVSGPVRRLQRRGAVRVPVGLLVQARLGDRPDDPEQVVGAVTENLSAGGALLRSATAMEPGRELRLSLRCGGTAGTIELAARVVRCDRHTGERPWRLAVAFHDMSAADEDRLVRFVFERQRELRRRATGLD